MPVVRAFWAIRIYFGMAKVKLTNGRFFAERWADFVRLTDGGLLRWGFLWCAGLSSRAKSPRLWWRCNVGAKAPIPQKSIYGVLGCARAGVPRFSWALYGRAEQAAPRQEKRRRQGQAERLCGGGQAGMRLIECAGGFDLAFFCAFAGRF